MNTISSFYKHYISLTLALLCCIVPGQAADIEFKAGFNLFSYPIQLPENLNCDNLRSTLGAESLKHFDGLAQRVEDCASTGFNIEPGQGYFVTMAAPGTVNFTGVADCPLVTLFPGVNLIGLPTPAIGEGCFDLLADIGDSNTVASIHRFEPVKGVFQSCAYVENFQGVSIQGTNFSIESGRAYLIHMHQQATDLSLNDPNQCLQNSQPIITSAPVIQTIIDSQYQYQLAADDPDNDPLTFSLVQAPLGMTVSSSTGLISWLPLNPGMETVTVRVDDGRGGFDIQQYQLEVLLSASVNLPVLEPVGNRIAPLGTTFSLQLSAADADLDPLLFSVQPYPLQNGMQLDSVSGLFTFTPSLEQVGIHELTFAVSDGRFTDSETITITVPQPGSVTSLSGQVLTSESIPLSNVHLEVGGIETFTDDSGNYVLNNIPVSGDVRLLVDGSTVPSDKGSFATVPEIVHLIEGADNRLDPPIVLLPLDTASADPVDPNTTSIITSSRFTDGLTISEPVRLTIPPGAAIDDSTGLPFTGEIHISRVPDPTQGPRPLPPDIGLSVYIAIQPFGVTYPNPVPISFPNLEGFPAGSRMDFFALNHATGAFEKIGEGLVSADGRTVDSIGGIVKSNSWHGIVPQQPRATPDQPPEQSEPAPGINDEPSGKPPCPQDPNLPTAPPDGSTCNDPTAAPAPPRNKECPACSFDKQTGNLSEYHELPNYYSLQKSRKVRLEYNSNNANPRPIVPMISGFGNQAPPPETMSLDITVGGVKFGNRKYSQVRIEPSEIRTQFKTTRPAIQINAQNLSTGLHDYAITVECQFPVSFRSETVPGQLIVDNRMESPFGAGWSLAGLQKVYQHTDGKILLTTGTATSLIYTPNADGSYRSPPGDYTVLSRQADGRFLRRMRNGTEFLFDLEGRQATETDRNGNVTQYLYDLDGRIEQITDPTGSAYTFSYFAGKIASINDPLNRTTRFVHDSEGNLIKIIEPEGDERKFEYRSGNHLMSAQLDQRGNRKEYTFDFAGRIKEALLPDGSRPIVEVSDVKGLIDPGLYPATRDNPAPSPLLEEEVNNQYTDHNGNVSVAESDKLNAPLKQIDAVGRETAYIRDIDSNPVETTRPNQSVIKRTFDDKGKALSVREEFNGATYRYTYDGFSLVNSVTNPRDHLTTLTRDARGNISQIVNHLGHTGTFAYDDRGLVTRQETPNGLVRTLTYNSQGLIETITETPPAASPGNVRLTRFGYDAAGQTTQVTTPDGVVLDLSYDDKGRLKRVTDNLNQSVTFGYDPHDNLIQTDTFNSGGDLALTVRQVFDKRNRLIDIQAPHSETEDSVLQRALDNNNNIVGLIDPNGNSSSSSYDGEDRLLEYVHRLDGITRYEYDTNDRITQVIAPNGATTEYTYDVLGRRLTETSPDRGTLSYSYDLADNVTSITDGRGITVTMTYDELERIKTKSFPNTIPGKIEDVSYVYDDCPFGLGRLCKRVDESGEYDYEYDVFGNIVKMTRIELGIAYITEYVYDDGDHIIQTTYPSGRVVDIARDGVRRMESISASVNSATQPIVSGMQYRANNRMTQCTFGNGLIDERQYDLQGRLSHQVLKTPTDQVVDERNYGFDLNGNILDRVTTPQTSRYAYDALDRIIGDTIDSAQPIDYQYDLNDNRLSKVRPAGFSETYFYLESSNRLLRQNQLTSDTPASAPNNRELVFNDANRLYQIYDDGFLIAEYIYNDNGQRTRKIIHNSDNSSQTILYHYDQNGYVISETDETGLAIRDYIWAEGMYPMAQIDRVGISDRISYLHTDHLMTNRLATDSTQAVVWRWEGEAFGNTPPQELAGIKVNLRFPGQYFDAETNLYYNWYRYYDPGLGRYITSDPIGLYAGLNLFGFVSANPIVTIDPLGLKNIELVCECKDADGQFLLGLSASKTEQLARYSTGNPFPPALKSLPPIPSDGSPLPDVLISQLTNMSLDTMITDQFSNIFEKGPKGSTCQFIDSRDNPILDAFPKKIHTNK